MSSCYVKWILTNRCQPLVYLRIVFSRNAIVDLDSIVKSLLFVLAKNVDALHGLGHCLQLQTGLSKYSALNANINITPFKKHSAINRSVGNTQRAHRPTTLSTSQYVRPQSVY